MTVKLDVVFTLNKAVGQIIGVKPNGSWKIPQFFYSAEADAWMWLIFFDVLRCQDPLDLVCPSDLLPLSFTCIQCFGILSRGGPDVWHDTRIKIKQLGLFLPSCAHMCLLLMCAIKGLDRVAFGVLMWRVSNSRGATYPVPHVRASLHSSVIN